MLLVWKDQYLAISYVPSTNLAIFKCPCDNVTVLPIDPWPIVRYAMMKLSMILPLSCWRWDDIQMISWSCHNLASLPCPGLPALRDRGHLSIIGQPPPQSSCPSIWTNMWCLLPWTELRKGENKGSLAWSQNQRPPSRQLLLESRYLVQNVVFTTKIKNNIVHKSSLLWHWMSISEIVIK